MTVAVALVTAAIVESRVVILFAGLAVVVAAVPAVSTKTLFKRVSGTVTKVPAVPLILMLARRTVFDAEPAIQRMSVADAAGGRARKPAENVVLPRYPDVIPGCGV